MNRFAKTMLAFTAAVILGLSIVAMKCSFGANVTDNGGGNSGYILINDGSGQGHRGTWVNPTTVPALKGDKGDVGATGDTGQNGKDIDPVTVINLQNTDAIIQNTVNHEATARLNSDNYLNNRIDDTNTRINDVSSRVSKLERTQFVLETSFRILDTQRISLRPFFRQNFTAGKIDIVGLRVDVKLGRSYEEKLIAKVNARLDAIEKTIGKAPVIEKVIDEKGNVKSISINGQVLTVTSQF